MPAELEVSWENLYLLCNATALAINDVAKIPFSEPGIQIDEYDREHGDDLMPDPLKTAHQCSSAFLLGAGDFIYSVGKLFSLEGPMLTSPAVLARSAVEYASRSWWLSVADLPELRISRMSALFNQSYQEMKSSLGSVPDSIEVGRQFNTWRSRQPHLPKAKVPKIANLVAKMLPTNGADAYEDLSRVAHGNLVQLLGTVHSANVGAAFHAQNAQGYGLFAAQVGLVAGLELCEMKGADRVPLENCAQIHTALSQSYLTAGAATG